MTDERKWLLVLRAQREKLAGQRAQITQLTAELGAARQINQALNQEISRLKDAERKCAAAKRAASRHRTRAETWKHRALAK